MILAEKLIDQLVEAKWTKLPGTIPGFVGDKPRYKHSPSGAETFWKGKEAWLKLDGKEYKLGKGSKASFDSAEKLIGDILSGKK